MISYKYIKRVAIAVIGGTVVLFGIVLIVLPGPAIIVIPAGLAILATEFAWAKRWLDKGRSLIEEKKRKLKERKTKTAK
jgi:tellurite resistance protein TerC